MSNGIKGLSAGQQRIREELASQCVSTGGKFTVGGKTYEYKNDKICKVGALGFAINFSPPEQSAPKPECKDGVCTVTFPEPIVDIKQNDDPCFPGDVFHDNYWFCKEPPPLRTDIQRRTISYKDGASLRGMQFFTNKPLASKARAALDNELAQKVAPTSGEDDEMFKNIYTSYARYRFFLEQAQGYSFTGNINALKVAVNNAVSTIKRPEPLTHHILFRESDHPQIALVGVLLKNGLTKEALDIVNRVQEPGLKGYLYILMAYETKDLVYFELATTTTGRVKDETVKKKLLTSLQSKREMFTGFETPPPDECDTIREDRINLTGYHFTQYSNLDCEGFNVDAAIWANAQQALKLVKDGKITEALELAKKLPTATIDDYLDDIRSYISLKAISILCSKGLLGEAKKWATILSNYSYKKAAELTILSHDQSQIKRYTELLGNILAGSRPPYPSIHMHMLELEDEFKVTKDIGRLAQLWSLLKELKCLDPDAVMDQPPLVGELENVVGGLPGRNALKANDLAALESLKKEGKVDRDTFYRYSGEIKWKTGRYEEAIADLKKIEMPESFNNDIISIMYGLNLPLQETDRTVYTPSSGQ